MNESIFEIEIKLYTSKELKLLFPNLELSTVKEIKSPFRKTNPFLDSNWLNLNSPDYIYFTTGGNYIFGWIRLKKKVAIQEKQNFPCRIAVWNKSFRCSFDIIGVTKEKSFFLIPLGDISIPDKHINYKIKTVR